jgi:hypothetical protein
MSKASIVQLAGGCTLVAGCSVLTLWLGLIVAGALLMIAAEAMDNTL